jgi:UPF0716 family protein affecting phage T7 exclusion
MEAEPFRLIIVILGLIWTVALVLLFVMTFILYRRMSAMRASIQKAVAETKQAAKPIMQIAAIIEVVKGGIDLVRRMSEIRKGGKQE